MFNMAYNIIKDFGALGIGLVQLGIIVFFGWKLFTNHLKHIQDKINSIWTRLEKNDEKLDKLGERVATIEGELK